MVSDRILLIGEFDKKIPALLKRLGYQLIEEPCGGSLSELLSRELMDLILLDGRESSSAADLCQYFSHDERLRPIPILVVDYGQAIQTSLGEQGETSHIEFLSAPLSIGPLASRIATLLRLRKFAGQDSERATLSEMNAALRDLNERFRHEREQARALQLALLPTKLPGDDRFQMAVAYQPLDEVGGDWYFAELQPDGRLGIQVADVTGHGLSAAFLGTMTKLALSAVPASAKREPAAHLRETNRLMAPLLPEGRFVTMMACCYDPASGALECGRAGHPPALVYARSTGAVSELRGEGFAIGFFEEAEYTSTQAVLEPGGVLILMTDGITEGQNRDLKTYGTESLKRCLREIPAAVDAHGILQALLDDFKKFCEGRLVKDDYTLLVLKRLK